MFLTDLENLQADLSLNIIDQLRGVFKKAEAFRKIGLDYNEEYYDNLEQQLNEELVEIIRRQHRMGDCVWHTSPSGKNHIITALGKCVFMNIFGAKILFSDWNLLEGQTFIRNIDWIEADSLVVFEILQADKREVRKCICHYTNDSYGFTYFTPAESFVTENKEAENGE